MGSEECGSNSRGEKINPQVCIEKSKFPKGRPEVQPQILRLRLAQNTRQSLLRMADCFSANLGDATLDGGLEAFGDTLLA